MGSARTGARSEGLAFIIFSFFSFICVFFEFDIKAMQLCVQCQQTSHKTKIKEEEFEDSFPSINLLLSYDYSTSY